MKRKARNSVSGRPLKRSIKEKYQWDEHRDKIGEGTYGKVYKVIQLSTNKTFAIKKFKNTKEGEGISLTACREIMLLRELKHPNIVGLEEVSLERDQQSSCLCMVFEYAEYDLFEIIRFHQDKQKPFHLYTIKSFMWQLLNGIKCMHDNWLLHRDIKPSNILVMGEGSKSVGTVKIADFGLARTFQAPLRPLYDNGIVVTIWYRAPELLLGAKHYTRAVDIWAIGCIFAELYSVKPLFPGKEKEQQNPNSFQDDQVAKIFNILGRPTPEQWPGVVCLPEWKTVMSHFRSCKGKGLRNEVEKYRLCPLAMDLLQQMLLYDPQQRISATDALNHPYFQEPPLPEMNAFGDNMQYALYYPKREPLKPGRY